MNAFLQIGVAFVLGALVTAAFGTILLPWLRRWKWGQEVRQEGPERHLAKAGTPTMGGLMFLLGVPLATWLAGARPTGFLNLCLLIFVVYGLIGFADDYIKVALRRPLGLKARHKLAGQALVAAYAGYQVAMGPGTAVALPFLGGEVDLGALYLVFAVLVALGAANAANLTDGLDGLLAGTTIAAAAAYTFISLAAGRPELAVFAAALAGGCAGFLRYNRHPALVFMGDTGSLAIGGALAALALLTKTELLLPLVAGLWVLEALSVIVQVAAFRLWGRRVLRMSPLHHHFELAGWRETEVVRRFWLVAAGFAALGLLGLSRLGGRLAG